jgi:hypothetical protein
MNRSKWVPAAVCAATLLWPTGTARAGENKVMHCFAWTSVKEATDADWQAFFRASDALPQKIVGISKVWYGKLAAPLSQTLVAKMDPESYKKLRAGENATGEVSRTARDWGMCMEMKDAETLKAYDSDPYHKIWTDAYSKVRVEGTTTFNILGR